VEKSKNRISDWKNKSLSFAGRLQLCKSVISSMHVYWASVLLIPKRIIYDIHQLIRGFLWCNDDYKRGKAKVAWEDICLPKWEGGLGLRNLDVHSLTPRDITREGFHIRNKVADLVSNGAWNWPHFWLQKALELNPIATSNIEVSRADIWQWRDSNGMLSAFSVTKLWEAIRPRGLQLAGNPMRNKRTARIIIGKLILAIASYFIWLERYNRLFKKVKKTPEDIRDTVIVSIRHVSFDVVVVQALA
ncbi:hypothetical protein Tco_0806534, partial [Tanacetum coccineum]